MWRSFSRLATFDRSQLSLFEERAYPLIERVQVARATHLLRFGLSDPQANLDLPVGKDVCVHLPHSEQRRAYTPTSSSLQRGSFDLMVKDYPEGAVSKRPSSFFDLEIPKRLQCPAVTRYLCSLKVGESAVMSGPYGEVTYIGDGHFSEIDEIALEIGAPRSRRVGSSAVAMIAGGIGITPMFQIVRWAVESGDQLKAHILFASREVGDVMLKPELDELVARADGRLKVYYSVDHATAGWPHLSGFVSKEMIKSTLPLPSECGIVFVCGPAGFHSVVAGFLEELGYDEGAICHFGYLSTARVV
eukprot:TRINITY_DN46707_c0_g1_i1.p1 TRINITY_DN46707_c0_g1~~TRINITY_DN46707_c0_g1_i1.p1  ORF type:complete len:303 (+),score=38.37 TRINITY_DN46707_c0_g1_i1:68-976(+)